MLFRFPWADEERARKWVANICRQTVDGKPWAPSKHDRVCSKHFADSDYQRHTKTKTLVANAIPSIFPLNPKYKRLAITPRRPLPRKRSLEISLSRDQPNKGKWIDILKFKCMDHPYAKEFVENDLEAQVQENKILTEKFACAKKELKVLKTKVKRQAKKIEDLFAEIKEKHEIVTASWNCSPLTSVRTASCLSTMK